MTSVPPPAAAVVAPVTTSASTTASRQVSGLTSVPSASSFVATDSASSSTSQNGSSRFLREVREDSDSDSDNPALPPLSQYARTRNTETAYSPMNTASFSMRRGSTSELPPVPSTTTTTTTPQATTPSATSGNARNSFLSRTASLDQESEYGTGVREPAAITSAPKIVPLSLRRRESSPLLLRQATMPVTASDKSAYVKRDFTSLRSRSPSADRESSKSTTNLDSYRSTQYTPPTTPTRRTNYDSGRDYSGTRYSSSSGRTGLSSLPYTSSSLSNSSSSSSAPRTGGLARSSTVGDMLSRSSRYTGTDRDMSSSYHSSSSMTSSARDPFTRRASPSATSSTSSRPSVTSSSSSYRRPSMSPSLTLTDATSN